MAESDKELFETAIQSGTPIFVNTEKLRELIASKKIQTTVVEKLLEIKTGELSAVLREDTSNSKKTVSVTAFRALCRTLGVNDERHHEYFYRMSKKKSTQLSQSMSGSVSSSSTGALWAIQQLRKLLEGASNAQLVAAGDYPSFLAIALTGEIDITGDENLTTPFEVTSIDYLQITPQDRWYKQHLGGPKVSRTGAWLVKKFGLEVKANTGVLSRLRRTSDGPGTYDDSHPIDVRFFKWDVPEFWAVVGPNIFVWGESRHTDGRSNRSVLDPECAVWAGSTVNFNSQIKELRMLVGKFPAPEMMRVAEIVAANLRINIDSLRISR